MGLTPTAHTQCLTTKVLAPRLNTNDGVLGTGDSLGLHSVSNKVFAIVHELRVGGSDTVHWPLALISTRPFFEHNHTRVGGAKVGTNDQPFRLLYGDRVRRDTA